MKPQIKSYTEWLSDKWLDNLSGYYADVPNEEYHAGPGLSRSGLKTFRISPLHYCYEKNNPKEETLNVNAVAHDKVLLGNSFFNQRYQIVNGKRTQTAKAVAASNGFTLLTKAEYDKVCSIDKGVIENASANGLLKTGINEITGYARHPEYGFLMKNRLDSLLPESNIIADFKNIGYGTSDWLLSKYIHDNYWHWQEVFYKYVHKLATGEDANFIFVCVEDKPPHAIKLKRLDFGSIDKAETEVFSELEKFGNCYKNNQWPGYSDQIEEIALPTYAF